MFLILTLTVVAALLIIDGSDIEERPWWPLLVVPALFVGWFVVVMLVDSWRSHRKCQQARPGQP